MLEVGHQARGGGKGRPRSPDFPFRAFKKKEEKKTKTKTPPLKLKCQSGQNSDSE